MKDCLPLTSLNEPIPAKRCMCARCLRPQSACICRWITPAASEVEVLILQHPMEVANAKGSARLLHLCLPNSRLAIGETFAEAELEALLLAPWPQDEQKSGYAQALRRPMLLYPELPESIAPDDGAPPAGKAACDRLPAQADLLRLVVLDATWRKSRKMLYQNPLLQSLPRLALDDLPPSRYLVRKAHLPHQLSTMEATCHALMRLENNEQKFQPLLEAFDGFIGQQLSFRPSWAGERNC